MQGKYYGSVLVHCRQGVSRSAAIVVAYLMKARGLSLDDALAYLRRRRPVVNPHEAFLRQLRDFEVALRREREQATAEGRAEAFPQDLFGDGGGDGGAPVAGPVRGPQAPARGPQIPVRGPQAPAARRPQVQVHSPHAPACGAQAPARGPQQSSSPPRPAAGLGGGAAGRRPASGPAAGPAP
ncbi:unnamed protein product, partial [Phaeothamnion confervicola]